jgi:hypothetical protein
MNGYDTVFANAKDEELEFETMFDQEDDLIDTIVGCNENGDPLTGADPCPVATAEDRSSSDDNPDYEKDVDSDDSKDAPKDAEGTVGYDFEEKPEIDGKVDDQTKPEAEPVEDEPEYQETADSDKGVEDTVTGTIENEKDVLESYFEEAEEELGYEEKDTEEERITDAPEVTPEDIEDTAKEVAKENDATDTEEVVKNDDKGVEDTVTDTIENDKDVLEAYFKEAEDELNGADTDPAKNAAERSCDDCNPDYEKDVDSDDSKDAPKDAEGTVGYDFEEKPEIDGKVDDQTDVDAKDVKIEEEADYDFDVTVPKDAEGTVGYDFEVNPEIGCKDDQSEVDVDDVKVEEEVDFDIPSDIPPEGAEKTSPAGPTDIATDCGDGECNTVGYSFENEAVEEDNVEIKKIDKDVEEIEDVEGYLDDDAIEDAETKDPDPNLDYDISDEEVIDYVINNK